MKVHKWADVRRKRSPEEESKITEKRLALEREMRLADLRRARGLTQATLADVMDIPQGEVSKIEHRTDVYLRTLRKYIEAMNGELIILARFPDADVPVTLEDEEHHDGDLVGASV